MITILCSMCPQTNMEGSLLTREQVEDISTRISQKVFEDVTKQLEQALTSQESSDNYPNIIGGEMNK